MSKSILGKLVAWPRKPAIERKRRLRILRQQLFIAPARMVLSLFPGVQVSYHPDSHHLFEVHPEFEPLFERFIAHNRTNNSGDAPRLWSLILNLKQIVDEQVPGDFAELGVYRGNTAAILASLAGERQVFLFDTFEGFSERDLRGVDANKKTAFFADTSIELVKKVVGEDRANCHYVKGWFPASTTAEHQNRQYAAVNLDCDLYEPMKAGLEFFYPRMSPGGIMFLHDYSSLHWAGAKLAVDEFCRATGEFVVLMPDKSGSAFLRKSQRS